MSVTFILGNGFDLSLGLKTRYADVYEEYVKEEKGYYGMDCFIYDDIVYSADYNLG